ncbi:TetR/AcrR family transcriptional regulator [Membranihabitans maritimus]|uniref:TetR/AcrR family transcriptional regulator n=1 Tax=Membranihabitans maritimus TaxID=2904244 RepID=UPI001F38C008|nr:TetR/AcrR family transcriptional regulator [Membranihabitans maritimus]
MSKLTTKEKIIQTAIKMYNEFGAQNVTSRHIASEIGISHGNLDYHYNTREDLMMAIYQQMRSEMSESYKPMKDPRNSFEHFHKLLIHLDNFQLKYRFFTLDVLEISRSYPKVSELLHETLELRKNQMSEFFDRFIEDGLIKDNSEKSYGRLKHTIRILITFWLPQQEVLTTYKYPQAQEMSKHIWELILPHMTEKGKDEYIRIVM